MDSVTIRELRNHGGEVVDRVEAGEHVTARAPSTISFAVAMNVTVVVVPLVSVAVALVSDNVGAVVSRTTTSNVAVALLLAFAACVGSIASASYFKETFDTDPFAGRKGPSLFHIFLFFFLLLLAFVGSFFFFQNSK